MSEITYRETFKIVVYIDGKAVGAIKKHPSDELYRYCPHGGGEKGLWCSSVELVKLSIEKAD